MPPKKEDKKKADEKQKGGTFTEVERTFLELTLAECNRKNARLLQAVNDYETRNDELQKAYDKLDEDRADIIAYLKKTLNVKTEENVELKEKVRGLEETREIETAQFKETVAELEKNFKIMKDQLTSENKLLAGKLNTLEEFRAIRDDLMKKFENQEAAFADQEMKYKRLLYEAEKKFVIGKDKLKKEMEARLLKLAQDFQDATELRIAASTHRVIRENIAISNELDSILQTQAKLADLNEKYKESERASRVAKELAEEERDKAINKNVVQLKVIDQLTNLFQEAKKEKALYHKRSFDFDTIHAKLQKCTKENENLSLQVRILEQNLHAKMTDQTKAFVESTRVNKENTRLKKILKEAAAAVQAALKLDEWAATDPTREMMDRQILLASLLEIVTKYRDVQRADSMDTLASFEKIYEEGDLGFIPKPVGKKKIDVATLASKESKESVSKATEKDSTATVSSSQSSLGSLKTIPSLQLIPAGSETEAGYKDSLPSFAESLRSSSASSGAKEEVQDDDQTDMEKALAASKLEIQKSIMADMALSMASIKSQARLGGDEPKKMSISAIDETEEDRERKEAERVRFGVEGEGEEGETAGEPKEGEDQDKKKEEGGEDKKEGEEKTEEKAEE